MVSALIRPLRKRLGGVHGCVDGTGPSSQASFRRNCAARCLVAPAARCVPGDLDVHRVRDLGGVPRRALRLRTLSLTVLLPGNLRRITAQLVRSSSGGVAVVAAVLTGPADPADSGALPLHLL